MLVKGWKANAQYAGNWTGARWMGFTRAWQRPMGQRLDGQIKIAERMWAQGNMFGKNSETAKCPLPPGHVQGKEDPDNDDIDGEDNADEDGVIELESDESDEKLVEIVDPRLVRSLKRR